MVFNAGSGRPITDPNIAELVSILNVCELYPGLDPLRVMALPPFLREVMLAWKDAMREIRKYH